MKHAAAILLLMAAGGSLTAYGAGRYAVRTGNGSGAVSNEIVHELDLFPTLAQLAGGKVPTDRIIDGKDQSDFLSGKQAKSAREDVVIYVGNDVHGVKWRNWKMMLKEMDSGDGPVRALSLPHFYNLLVDQKEEYPAAPDVPENLWVRFPASKEVR